MKLNSQLDPILNDKMGGSIKKNRVKLVNLTSQRPES